MENIYGWDLSRLEQMVADLKFPRFAAKQIALWIYQKKVYSWDDMSNLSRKNREILSKQFIIQPMEVLEENISSDQTRKYLFKSDSSYIETAFIPEEERATLCLSTQKGCRMGCTFCATGLMGWKGNLSSGEILSQLTSLPEEQRELVTNFVFMGMGEPLDNFENLLEALNVLTGSWGLNYSKRRITVSTIGLPGNLKRLITETDVNIALSLHNPFPEERGKIVPIEKKHPLRESLEVLKLNPVKSPRKLTMEYTMLEGENDSSDHARELISLLRDFKGVRINLIPVNSHPGAPFSPSREGSILEFQEQLKKAGFLAFIRKSRGSDIQAACGLLSGKKERGDLSR